MNNIRLLKGELTQTCIVIVYLPSYCVEHKRRYIENVNVVVVLIVFYIFSTEGKSHAKLEQHEGM